MEGYRNCGCGGGDWWGDTHTVDSLSHTTLTHYSWGEGSCLVTKSDDHVSERGLPVCGGATLVCYIRHGGYPLSLSSLRLRATHLLSLSPEKNPHTFFLLSQPVMLSSGGCINSLSSPTAYPNTILPHHI
jgi:hypothetical protein